MTIRHLSAALILLLTATGVTSVPTPMPRAPGHPARRFVQERHLQGFAKPLVSEGHFVLVRVRA